MTPKKMAEALVIGRYDCEPDWTSQEVSDFAHGLINGIVSYKEADGKIADDCDPFLIALIEELKTYTAMTLEEHALLSKRLDKESSVW